MEKNREKAAFPAWLAHAFAANVQYGSPCVGIYNKQKRKSDSLCNIRHSFLYGDNPVHFLRHDSAEAVQKNQAEDL